MKGFFVAFDALPKESLMFLDLVQNTIFQKHNNNHNKALISKTYFSFVIPNIKVPFCGGGSFLEEEAYVQNTYFQYSGVGWKKRATTNTNNTILFRKSRQWIKGYLYAWLFASEKKGEYSWHWDSLHSTVRLTMYSEYSCGSNIFCQKNTDKHKR